MITIPLANSHLLTNVDDDYIWLLAYRWLVTFKRNHPYAITYIKSPLTGQRECYALHRVVAGCSPKDGFQVDHVDHDTLNNTRSNLRKASIAQNSRNREGLNRNNTLGFPGLELRKHLKKPWKETLMYNQKKINLGYYASFDEAKSARIVAEQKYFEEFAPQRELDIE